MPFSYINPSAVLMAADIKVNAGYLTTVVLVVATSAIDWQIVPIVLVALVVQAII